jgi:ketosteroid isomerase-like protein
MSEENVAAFKRVVDAANRRDVEAALEELDPEVEWHPVIQMLLGGEATMYRGREGVRDVLREADEAWAETHYEFSEIRDLGDRIVAIGRFRARGKESAAEVESPLAYIVQFKNGKAIRMWSYFDPNEALEAAGLQE